MSKSLLQAKYRAHTNIALIKYWGKRNQELYLPVTSSLSMTLDGFYTDTEVEFSADFESDSFFLNGVKQGDSELNKISRFVDLFRHDFKINLPVRITSVNHVPTAAGLASSASAYAALASAINAALDLNLSNETLSTYARQGSGSSTRSLFGGFALWHKGNDEDPASSYAEQIDTGDWDIAMIAIVINNQRKKISSRAGMQATLESSPFYRLWPEEVARDLEQMIPAIHAHDTERVGQIAEHNAMKMHATSLAANPSFTYWQPESILAMDAVRDLRDQGIPCYFTMDAGPNVKVICRQQDIPAIKEYLTPIFTADQLITSKPGPAPYPIS